MRAALLPPAERILVETVYREGASAKAVALLRGDSPRKVRRQLKTILQRMLEAKFVFVARERDRWPRQRERVATACVLHGCSLRQSAQRLDVSLHTVRRHMQAVQTLFEADLGAKRAARDGASTLRARGRVA